MRALDHAVERVVIDAAASSLNDNALAGEGDRDSKRAICCRSASDARRPTNRAIVPCNASLRLGSRISVMSNTRGGILRHALVHQIGPMWNVPHGVTFMASPPAARDAAYVPTSRRGTLPHRIAEGIFERNALRTRPLPKSSANGSPIVRLSSSGKGVSRWPTRCVTYGRAARKKYC